jgi:hypothetical protein
VVRQLEPEARVHGEMRIHLAEAKERQLGAVGFAEGPPLDDVDALHLAPFLCEGRGCENESCEKESHRTLAPLRQKSAEAPSPSVVIRPR